MKFALRSDHEVDSIQPDHIPPPKEKHYDFQERDPGIVPPIGNKYLMHRLSDPKHCKDSTFCLTQIPKRIDSPPRYGMTPDHFTAWGLYFQEGMDLELLCWWGLLAFSFSLIFGITWAIVKHSVQDGFVIASYILAFETIALGTAQVAVGLNMVR